MKTTIMFYVLILAAVSTFLSGQNASAQSSDKPALKVLVTYGGHAFEEKEFREMFDAMQGIEYEMVELPKAFEMIKPGLEEKYDAIVMYDMITGIPKEQLEAFDKLLKENGIGLVSWHHNLAAHREWPKYRDIIGGAYVFEEYERDGVRYGPSIYNHWDSTEFTIADPNHPITKGLPNFKIENGGETYGECYIAKNIKVLLTTNQEKTVPQQLWVKRYGKSRVVHFMPGHGKEAFGEPTFRELLRRSIIWSAKPVEAEEPQS